MTAPSGESSLLRDLLNTSAAQAVSVALSALSLIVISRRLGEPSLGAYALERRAMALIQPIVLLGITVAAPRYIAGLRPEDRSGRRAQATSGLTVVTAAAGVLALAMALLPETVAAAAFGDEHAVGLARALAFFVFSTAVYQVVYSTLRGYMINGPANLLELLVVGALPLAAAIAGPRDVADLVEALSAAILLCAAVWAAIWLRDRIGASVARVRAAAATQLRFGIVRTPGDLAVVGLFSLGPVLVAHVGTPREAGYASVVLSSLNLISIAAIPLSTLLLPRVAAHERTGEARGSPRYRFLWNATVDVGIGLCGLLVAASALIIAVWLPSRPDEAVLGQQLAALGIPGYVVYLVFRSYLDALHVRPYSSYAALAGLTVMALGLVAVALEAIEPVVGVSIAAALGLTATGLVTWRLAAPTLELTSHSTATLPAALWLGCVTAAALAVGPRVGACALLALTAVVTYAAILGWRRPSWAATLLARLSRRSEAPA